MREFVYITSPSFSGSTLLTFLLNLHPDITTIGEMKGESMDLQRYSCSCGSPIGKCGFWKRLVAGMHARGTSYDLTDVWTQCGFRIPDSPFLNRLVRHRHHSRPIELLRDAVVGLSPTGRWAFRRISRTNAAFVATVNELQGGSVFVDSSKDPIRLKYLRRLNMLPIKVIHIVRDGRGVMLSSMKHYGWTPHRAANEVATAMREIEHVLGSFDDSSKITVCYEDLCRDPDASMKRLFSFIGVKPERAATDLQRVEHHILGNSMRLGGISEIRLDSKWMRELTAEHLALFDRIAGRLNGTYGYDSLAKLADKADSGLLME